MPEFRFLSHPLGQLVPSYGNEQGEVTLKQLKSLKSGDSCNTFWFGMENHLGTHVDAPAHFFDGAMTISDYPPNTWKFEHPCVINMGLREDALISVDYLKGQMSQDNDILLIQSGFQQLRDNKKYCYNNPGITAEVGFWLRAKHPSIRAIGFDFISLSPFQNRSVGQKAHRAFLDPSGTGTPILIIEDMDLAGDLSKLCSVWIAPIRIEGLDSAPCTVIGVFR